MFFTNDIGIDLGTSSILVYIKGRGVVLKEPSIVAVERDTNQIKAIGEEAKILIGRTPGNIIAVQPVKQGVISDSDMTEKMLRYFIRKAVGKKTLRKPRIGICIPAGATEVEKRAVEEAAYLAGAREVTIIEEPLAAAVGTGINIDKPTGNMIADIGGGSTDIAVVAMGGTIVSSSVKVAGDDFDEALVRYLKSKYSLLVVTATAEEIKRKIGCVYTRPELLAMDVTGRDLATGMPKTVTVNSDETMEALREPAMQIVGAVRDLMEKIPPELAADIQTRGMIMTGGGCLLNGLDILIEEKLGIGTVIAEKPLIAVAIGTGRFMEMMEMKTKRKKYS